MRLLASVVPPCRPQCSPSGRLVLHRPIPSSPTPVSLFRSAGIRHASTAQETAKETAQEVGVQGRSLARRIKHLFLGASVILVGGFGYLYITDTRAGLHQWLVPPLLRTIYPDAEEAHHAGTEAMKVLYSFGLHPRERDDADAKGDLAVEVFGHTLANPIGISAGLDKHADLPSPLFALGPAIVEVGGVTPLPQEGNPKPRVFRIPSQNALINRYGLNSEGADFVAMRLRQRVREFAYHMGFGLDEYGERMVLDGAAGVPPGSLSSDRLLAVQCGKQKNTPEGDIEAVTRDYVYCVQHLGKYADILVVNVSSPNTPGLRSLQSVEPLTHLLTGVVRAAKDVDRKTKPAVMVKVSPDEDSEEQIYGICEAIWKSGVDGVIVGNTTKKRPDPIPKGFLMPKNEVETLLEQGGYSGPQMFERTKTLVARYRRLLDQTAEPTAPSKVIFATGGITNGKQALEVLNAGASVAMIYTAMVYGG